ncbi:MAG: hypothetical protein MRY32_08310 [Rickettsiales bacterium]|nr:hypothetical protein [Rickettsiales bacterium]
MRLAHKLSEISAVEVEKITSSERVLFRVLLGPTLNKETASELKNRLSEYNVKDGRIIRK